MVVLNPYFVCRSCQILRAFLTSYSTVSTLTTNDDSLFYDSLIKIPEMHSSYSLVCDLINLDPIVLGRNGQNEALFNPLYLA